MTTLTKDTPITFTANQLGLIDGPDGHWFVEETVGSGDEGTYVGEHPNSDLASQGWILARVEVNGRTLYCPCHTSQFLPTASGRKRSSDG